MEKEDLKILKKIIEDEILFERQEREKITPNLFELATKNEYARRILDIHDERYYDLTGLLFKLNDADENFSLNNLENHYKKALHRITYNQIKMFTENYITCFKDIYGKELFERLNKEEYIVRLNKIRNELGDYKGE